MALVLRRRMNQKLPSPSSINEYFPSKILLEIFYKLPVKELYKNKIVCKLWSSLISRHSFSSEYSTRTSKRPTLTFYLSFMNQGDLWRVAFEVEPLTYEAESKSWSKDSLKFSLDFLPDIPRQKISYGNVLASSNGLLLCCRAYYEIRMMIYYVCNPVTKESFILPPPPSEGLYMMGIVCYPGCETQFKVVKIFQTLNTHVMDIEVFESATNEWKELTFDAKNMCSPIRTNGIEHRGILHWNEGSMLRTLDPNLDLYSEIPLPGISADNGMLGESQDHLYYVEIYLPEESNIPESNIPECTIWRCDEEYIWNVDGKFDLSWIFDQYNISLKDDGLDCTIHAIDPLDCNILYMNGYDPVLKDWTLYSIDVRRKQAMELCSIHKKMDLEYTINGILPFVHPT